MVGCAVVLALTFGGVTRATDTAPREEARPSILLLTVDTLRADRLTDGQCSPGIAPFLDHLASRAKVFSSAYSTSSWTVPAMASLATGLYPWSHGVVQGISRHGTVIAQPRIPDAVPRLASELQRGGYRTFAVVANAHLAPELGFARGFDDYRCVGFKPAEDVLATLRPMLDLILASDAGPFFLWLHFFDPHMPYRRRQPWFSRFAPDPTAEELAVLDRAASTWPHLPREIHDHPERYAAIGEAMYDSEIARLDALLEGLFKDEPRLAQSFVVFTADHGEEFLEHGRTGHGNNLYRETVQIPLWVRPPGGEQGSSESAVASLVDVPPTLLQVAGLNPPASWPGRSLLDPLPPEREVLAQLAKVPTRQLEALIGARWKLVETRPAGETELYDLRADSAEREDLSDRLPAMAQQLRARLRGRVDALPHGAPPPAATTDDAETIEQLRALGYLEPPIPPG